MKSLVGFLLDFFVLGPLQWLFACACLAGLWWANDAVLSLDPGPWAIPAVIAVNVAILGAVFGLFALAHRRKAQRSTDAAER